MNIEKLTKWGGFIFYAGLTLLPLAGFQWSKWSVDSLFLGTRQLALLGNSILLASLSAFLSCILGCLVAVSLRSSRLYSSVFRWIILVTAPLPFYIYALSWMYGVRWVSKWNRELAIFGYKGLAACLFVEVMTFLPLCSAMILFGMEQQNREAEDMAFLYRSVPSVVFRIILPQLLPHLTAVFGCVFVISITDYSVPSLFQFQTYIMDLFSEYSRGAGMAHVAARSLSLIVLVFVFIALIQGNLRRFTLPAKDRRGRQLRFGRIWRMIPAWGLVLASLQLLFPLIVFLYTSGSMGNVVASLLLIRRELFISAGMSLLAGLLAVFAAYGMAKCLMGCRRFSAVLWQFALFVLAIPGPMIAMGLLSAVNGSPVHALSQTIWLPVLGYTIRYMPFALLILAARLKRVDRNRLDLGRLLSKDRNQYFLKVELPMLFPGLCAAFAAVFLLSMGEEGIGLVLMPAGLETMAVKIYNYLHYGASEMISGFSLVTMLLTGTIIVMILLQLDGKKGK